MEATKSNLISFQKVGLTFPSGGRLFHNLNFVIPAHSFHFLTGISGAGKSTLLRMIFLDQLPTEGRAFLFDKYVGTFTSNQAALLRRHIGVVFQNFRLLPHLTILENVALPLKIRGIHTKKREREAAELLEWVGLKEHLHDKPDILSGGQQQRVAIVRAIIGKPRLLLADEPTGNVDDMVAMRLLHLMEELYKAGTTVIVATHNHALADAFPYPELTLVDGGITAKPKKVIL